MPDDFDSKIDALSAKSAPAADDFDSKIDALNPPKAAAVKAGKGYDFAGAAKSFASNILPGLAEIPEQLTNAIQYGNRHTPFPFNAFPDMSSHIDTFNRLAGAPAQPYMDATNAMRQNPAMGFGQTPNQLMQQHPVTGTLGNFAGNALTAPLLGPGVGAELASKIPALAKLGPLAGKIIGSGIAGGEFASAQQGLQNMGDQVKTNDRLDPMAAAISAEQAFLPGMALGAGAGALAHGLPALAGNIRYANDIKAAQAKRIAKQNERIEARKGNQPLMTPEQTERVEEGKGVNTTWEKFQPGELGPGGGANNQFQPNPHAYGEAPAAPPESGLPPGPTNAGTDLSGLEPSKADYSQSTKLEAKVDQLVDDKSRSWRERREAQARPPTPSEKPLLEPVANLAAIRDKAAGRLAGAIEQVERRLGLKPTARNSYIRPDLDDIRIAFIKEHGLVPKGMKKPYIEATLSRETMYPREYEFKATSMLPKMKELEKLIEEYRLADKNYENSKLGLTEQLPLNHTIAIEVRDSKGSPRVVNIRNREQATGYTGELEKQYKELVAKLSAESGPYYDRTPEVLQTLINKELKSGNATLAYLRDKGALSWFNSQSNQDKAKLVLAISLTASAMMANQQQAQAAPPPNIIGKTLVKLAKTGWEHAQGVRVVARVTASQVTSDVIREGFDTASRTFAGKRDAYLAALRPVLSGSKELTAAEEEVIKGMKRPDIMRTPVLKGWTSMQRTKLADAMAAHEKYTKDLQSEIARVESLAPKGKTPFGVAGKERYYRMLYHDLQDLGATPGAPTPQHWLNSAYSKLFGSANTSYFWGNYRTAVFHLAEMAVAYAASHPVATTEALTNLIKDPVYRKFCIANSPKGMFQRVLEGQEKLPIQVQVDKWINEPFDKFIKAHVGEVGFDALSAQLPERAKLGIGATITAVHNARTYPGGPKAYMQDWLNLAEKNQQVPPAKQAQFVKIGVQNLIDDNKAIMFLPEGPIVERTVFQRHDLTKPFYPYLRAVVQQTRFFSALIDDMMHAKTTAELGTALRTFLMGTVMVWAVTGSGALPNWLWNVMEVADKQANGNTKNVDKFRDAVDDSQKFLTGGIQMRDFGVKWFPYLAHEPKYWLGQFVDRDIRQLSFKDKQEVVKAVINSVAVMTINRIGFQGTQNLEYLRELVMKGISGSEDYKRYNENWIMNKVMGRPFTGKIAEGKLKYDLPMALTQWLLKIQTKGEGEVIAKGEKKESKQFLKDVATIGHNIRR